LYFKKIGGKIMLRIILSPLLYLMMLLLAFILTFLIFDNSSFSIEGDHEYVFFLCIMAIAFLGFIFQYGISFNKIKHQDITPYGLNIMIIMIILSNVIEYALLGIPLLDNAVSYHTFGLPYVHHISVTSWILVFALKKQNPRTLNIFLVGFAFLNPILMQNRDILLLTFYTTLVVLTINNKMSFLRLALSSFTIVFLFGVLGTIRSPTGLINALQSLPLKISYDVDSIWFSLNWFLIYITGSIFNSLYLISGKGQLYYEHINAVSEFTSWYLGYGLFGFLIFELFLIVLAFIMLQISIFKPKLISLYVYINFQIIMSLFSKKLFITNTVFTIMFIFGLFIALHFFKKRTSQ
ncbi:hypothetical protein, partial [Vibrio coralliilyticus]